MAKNWSPKNVEMRRVIRLIDEVQSRSLTPREAAAKTGERGLEAPDKARPEDL